MSKNHSSTHQNNNNNNNNKTEYISNKVTHTHTLLSHIFYLSSTTSENIVLTRRSICIQCRRIAHQNHSSKQQQQNITGYISNKVTLKHCVTYILSLVDENVVLKRTYLDWWWRFWTAWNPWLSSTKWRLSCNSKCPWDHLSSRPSS